MPPETLRAIAEMMTDGGRHPEPSVKVIGPGDDLTIEGSATIELEDGSTMEVNGRLPEDLPPGYHRLDSATGSLMLAVSPGKVDLPEGLRTWGWAVQLYALRSRSSWGIGDFGDLARFGASARRAGASLVLLNPLHAVAPVIPQQNSPYYPTSRCFKNPLYLDVHAVRGADAFADLAELDRRGAALNACERVPRDAVFELKMEALGAIWAARREAVDIDDFCAHLGPALEDHATYCLLAESHGADWRTWPAELRDPSGSAVKSFRESNRDRVDFHRWVQGLIDQQLATAALQIDLVEDLAIGVDPGGSDAWIWQECFATEVSVGAPPDDYSADGQDWGVVGFDPVHLRARSYEPFIEMLRATMRNSAAIRFDHVMGLFRLFWVPRGKTAASGAYVRYPSNELLDILALESQRAGAAVIGEDLGTVEPKVREEMAHRSMLGYRLLWFMDKELDLPYLAMAAANTHDLPTTAGLWTGADATGREKAGAAPNEEFFEEIAERIQRHLGIERDASVTEVVDAACKLLAACDSAIVTVAIDDVMEATDRYNFPGTNSDQNWTNTLPMPVEEIVELPRFAEISQMFEDRNS